MARRSVHRKCRLRLAFAAISALSCTALVPSGLLTSRLVSVRQAASREGRTKTGAGERNTTDRAEGFLDQGGQSSETEAKRQSSEPEQVDPLTYVFGKPGELRRDLGVLNSSPEKLVLVGLLSLAIGLLSNLWGQTELLFRVVPAAGQMAVELHLDSIYAVDGLRAYYAEEYEARFPSEWLADQRVALIKARQLGPDLTSSRRARGSAPEGVQPDAAWGPAGGGQRSVKERENLSVVKQQVPARGGVPVSISDMLGEPQASLNKLLGETIAPPGSKKIAEALGAETIQRGGNTYYQYQWRTTFESGFQLRTYSSAALGPPDARGSRYLYTLTAVLPENTAARGEGIAASMSRVLEGFKVEGTS